MDGQKNSVSPVRGVKQAKPIYADGREKRSEDSVIIFSRSEASGLTVMTEKSNTSESDLFSRKVR